MSNILTHYSINEKTLALLPARNIDYSTIILESTKTLYSRQTAMNLINNACLEDFSSYTGRREAVIHQTGYKRKVPIDTNRNIITFPTLSPTEFNCTWIFYNHIHSFQPIKHNKQTLITFNNGVQLTVDVSHFVIEKQVQRTARCLLMGSRQDAGMVGNW